MPGGGNSSDTVFPGLVRSLFYLRVLMAEGEMSRPEGVKGGATPETKKGPT